MVDVVFLNVFPGNAVQLYLCNVIPMILIRLVMLLNLVTLFK